MQYTPKYDINEIVFITAPTLIGEKLVCPVCKGVGTIDYSASPGEFMGRSVCPRCEGAKILYKHTAAMRFIKKKVEAILIDADGISYCLNGNPHILPTSEDDIKSKEVVEAFTYDGLSPEAIQALENNKIIDS